MYNEYNNYYEHTVDPHDSQAFCLQIRRLTVTCMYPQSRCCLAFMAISSASLRTAGRR